MKYCGNCGRPTAEHESFCGHCGAPFRGAGMYGDSQFYDKTVLADDFQEWTTGNGDQQSKSGKTGMNKLIIALVGVIIILLVIAAGIAAFFVKDGGNSEQNTVSESFHGIEAADSNENGTDEAAVSESSGNGRAENETAADDYSIEESSEAGEDLIVKPDEKPTENYASSQPPVSTGEGVIRNEVEYHTDFQMLNDKYDAEATATESGVQNAYRDYDALLNEMYQYLKNTLPESEFSVLRQSEIEWIKQKEAAAESSEGAYYRISYNFTKERCKYLLDNYF